ncbi:hypothetical protein P5673_027468 [Acropora cervicornis]|uniref:Uncharacterized protein n=1 Tax=Acropora cervicornis TaxID=6130 RepID=A0AAD9UW14_ACRCE|nr:hypothetical protein P5673_027468 [Acropora cervicornis]
MRIFGSTFLSYSRLFHIDVSCQQNSFLKLYSDPLLVLQAELSRDGAKCGEYSTGSIGCLYAYTGHLQSHKTTITFF